MRPKRRPIRPKLLKRKDCYFCKQKIAPDYKETETLKHSLSERGKIIAKGYTGVCQKHQRMMGR